MGLPMVFFHLSACLVVLVGFWLYLLFFRAQAEENVPALPPLGDDRRLRVKSAQVPLVAKVKMGMGASF